MNFLHILWAMALFAFYTDPGESPMWVSMDIDGEEETEKPFLFFATTRPVEDTEHLQLLADYGWQKVINPKHEWQGSLFRHVGW